MSIDPLAPDYPFWSPYVFSGNQVINSVELEGLEPEEIITHMRVSGGMINLLTAAFGYSRYELTQSFWIATDRVNSMDSDAMVLLGRKVYYKEGLYASDNKMANYQSWFNLVAHEQYHIEEMGRFESQVLWYLSYGYEWLASSEFRSFNDRYHDNSFEKRAYKYGHGVSSLADDLWAYNGNEVYRVLTDPGYSKQERDIELLKVGLNYRLDWLNATMSDLKKQRSLAEEIKNDVNAPVDDRRMADFFRKMTKPIKENLENEIRRIEQRIESLEE